MLVSYNWLKNYIDISISPSELVDKLNVSGLPVEDVHEIKPPFMGVVVAKILTKEKHPQADNLNLCDVTDGTETLKIVCGAPNVEAGQIVALAKIGAELPGGFKIKKAKIRGVESNGMICSLSELGFEKESDGILVLDPSKFTVGTPYSPFKQDTVLSLEITPNRPDLLCVTGVARFIASRTGLTLKSPSCTIAPDDIGSSLDINSKLKINLQSPALCPRYSARIIEGVKIRPSPDWLKDTLTAMGIRPINNIVDV
ncbi:MAG: phenylalanine--tRNA ligase subunit beta, partial [Spirochaetia bacterium]|nr:phenylalanine--tRNA ligase subunit beta [Spirochaetia bacterium]